MRQNQVLRRASISGQESTRVTDAMLQAADRVVTACGLADEHCLVLPPGTRKEHWRRPGVSQIGYSLLSPFEQTGVTR